VVGLAGYFLRRHVLEVAPTERRVRMPRHHTLQDHWRTVPGFAGLSAFNTVTFYVGFVYLVSWLQLADGIPPSRALGQFGQHDGAVAGDDRDRAVDRPLWPQALHVVRMRSWHRRRAAGVLAVEPSLGRYAQIGQLGLVLMVRICAECSRPSW
jgi:hypothetical protein